MRACSSTHSIAPFAALATLALLASCEDTGDPSESCPDAYPDVVRSCSQEGLTCSYVVEPCDCGADLRGNCTCTSGTWECYREYDCYPWSFCPATDCPAATPEPGTGCTTPEPGTFCEYVQEDCACGEDLLKYCGCEEGAWVCRSRQQTCDPCP